MNELEKFIMLNSIIVIEANEDTVTLKQYEEMLTLKIDGNEKLIDINQALAPLSGKRACIVNSDVLGIENQKIKLKRLEKHILHKILALTLKEYLPYLIKVAKEEGSSLLLQSHYEVDTPALSITAGLIDDIQVLLLDVHYERNERMVPC